MSKLNEEMMDLWMIYFAKDTDIWKNVEHAHYPTN